MSSISPPLVTFCEVKALLLVFDFVLPEKVLFVPTESGSNILLEIPIHIQKPFSCPEPCVVNIKRKGPEYMNEGSR